MMGCLRCRGEVGLVGLVVFVGIGSRSGSGLVWIDVESSDGLSSDGFRMM